jgi:hypothetical protein
MVTVPLYVPNARLPGFAETCTELGVVLLTGETESQLPPLAVVTEAVKLSGTGVPETAMVWVAGTLAPDR